MTIRDARSAVDLIRDASKTDLVIVSLFLLPLLLGGWTAFLKGVDYLDNHAKLKFLIVCGIVALYIIGIVIMKWWDPEDEKLRRAVLHVRHRLEHRPRHWASFDAIRSEVNATYTDPFLNKLIEKNGLVFRRVRIKTTNGNKDGLALVEEEAKEEEL
jgi:hypothetical protein